MVSRLAVPTAICSLALVAPAVAGTATVTDKDEPKIPNCADIKSIKADAGSKNTTFTVAMYGKAAKACEGRSPSIEIFIDKDGVSDCITNLNSQNGEAIIHCQGLNKATYKRSGKVWTISFKTSSLGKGVEKFRFLGIQLREGGSDTAPNNRKKPKSVSIG